MLFLVYTLAEWPWLTAGLIGLLSFILVHHFTRILSLPPGPFPLPVLGNIIGWRQLPKVLSKYHDKYNDIFCLWIGNRPSIFVCSWDLCREALLTKRNDFNGRLQRHTTKLNLGGYDDITFADFGPSWETLRKIMENATRKYVAKDHVAELISDVLDKTVLEIRKENGPVDASAYMYLIIYNIRASSVFGRRFENTDPEFVRLRDQDEEVQEQFSAGLPTDVFPYLKMLYKKRAEKTKQLFDKSSAFIEENFKSHQNTYKSGEIRDFTDAILAAKEEVEKESRESLQYLTDGNMVKVLGNLFRAGTDTTRAYLLWIILIMCHFTGIQKKMQAEIDRKIGSRMPTQKDKLNCHYVTAVMTEVMRFRPVRNVTEEHKTTRDTDLDGYNIPKDTSCWFYIRGAHYDTKHWNTPQIFKPERFLDAKGQFTSERVTSYMPFGVGRRGCPGEELALADTFLIIARLLQDYNFELENGPGSVTLEPDDTRFTSNPVPYKFLLRKRSP